MTMTCSSARETFPELLDRRTPVIAHADARQHLAHCPDCQREFAALTQTADALDTMAVPPPSPRLRQNFYTMLEEEKHSAESVRLLARREQRAHRATLWRWVLSPLAACALLFVGYTLGQRAVPPPAPSPVAAKDDSTQRELQAVREQLAQQRTQLDNMTKLVSISILQQQQSPANERLREVLAAAKSPNPTNKTLEDLVVALTIDPIANVRLRAIEALFPHAEREIVRAGVLAALPRERNPLVQLELIDFIATAQDRAAAPVLETLTADESLELAVREAAKLALAQL
jgi:flagellar motility protein MotE (MotC chaperone)